MSEVCSEGWRCVGGVEVSGRGKVCDGRVWRCCGRGEVCVCVCGSVARCVCVCVWKGWRCVEGVRCMGGGSLSVLLYIVYRCSHMCIVCVVCFVCVCVLCVCVCVLCGDECVCVRGVECV